MISQNQTNARSSQHERGIGSTAKKQSFGQAEREQIVRKTNNCKPK
jgi:hypothetical protein